MKRVDIFNQPKPRKRKSNAGRPSAFTPELLNKLEEAFKIGCTDEEACLNADISTTALYNYQNRHPEFVERKERLKQRPFWLARKSVVDRLARDPELALKYLERKKKDEFSTRQETTGKDGGPVEIKPVEVMELGEDKLQAKSDSANN